MRLVNFTLALTTKKIFRFTRLMLLAAGLLLLAGLRLQAGTGPADRTFTFTYSTTVAQARANQTGPLEIWIPLPVSDPYQEVLDYKIEPPLAYTLVGDPQFDNEIMHFEIDSLIPDSVTITVTLDIRRVEENGWSHKQSASTKAEENLQQYLQPDELVPIDGPIAEEARQVVGDASGLTNLQKAELLYNHLLKTMKYDKSGVGWGHGDALYACSARAGNCTDIHSLFIGMARSLGIPSRFTIGFPLPETGDTVSISGYHCWAEFYDDDHGWLPVDISEAIKHPEKADYFFGRIDANRVAFTKGRDIKLESAGKSHSLNYFVYPYVLLNNEPFAQVSNKFTSYSN